MKNYLINQVHLSKVRRGKVKKMTGFNETQQCKIFSYLHQLLQQFHFDVRRCW
jgi:hypothetical protein